MGASEQVRQAAKRYLTRKQRDTIRGWLFQLQKPLLQARMRRSQRPDLDTLAKYYGTDKSSTYHGYTRRYETHFSERRAAVRQVLEIGVGGTDSWRGYDTPAGGQSLLMWRDYFPGAHVLGVDLHDKAIEGDRISFEQGDQADAAFLQSLVERYGPFDIIIDDGSHRGEHILATFDVLWSALRPNGFYVIEDLETAYEPSYGGGPPGTPGTAAALLKDCVDHTQQHEQDSSVAIAALGLYEGIAFLQKAA